MNSRRQTLWLRRQALLARSAELRDRLQRHGEALAPVFAVADGAAASARWLRAHPLVPAAAIGWLLLSRPARLLRWGRRGWQAWKLLRRLRPIWQARAGLVASLLRRRAP